MADLNILKLKLLKKIKNHPNGISTENLINPKDKESGITYALEWLEAEGYLYRKLSQDNKIAQAFKLDVNKHTGDWLLTDKGKEYISNNRIESSIKLINRIIGFVSGVAATFLAEALAYFIIQKIT